MRTPRTAVTCGLMATLLGVSCAVAWGPRVAESAEPDSAVETVADLPDEPLQRCATKALSGWFGELEDWQREGYERALQGDVRQVRAWVTTYFPEEGFPRGQTTRYGHGVDERCVAANLLPAYTWVWHPRTGIRQVLDTGARRNDRVARRKGADLWLDFWEPVRGSLWGDDNAGVRQIWVIGA